MIKIEVPEGFKAISVCRWSDALKTDYIFTPGMPRPIVKYNAKPPVNVHELVIVCLPTCSECNKLLDFNKNVHTGPFGKYLRCHRWLCNLKYLFKGK